MAIIDWSRLLGRMFRTVQGAPFTVVNVTPQSVVIQPASGHRRYEINIASELERILETYRLGGLLPKPYDLVRAGVRHERVSYAWGILHALLAEDQVLGPEAAPIGLMQLVKVNAGTVYALGYDPAARALEVVFWSGEIWRYEDVSPEEYRELLTAPSSDRQIQETVNRHRGCRLHARSGAD